MTTSKVSLIEHNTAIVMTAHDQHEYTVCALASLAANTRKPYHVFLVDDASTDATRMMEDKPWLTILRHPERGRITEAWNTGMRHVLRQPFGAICLTNNDVLFGPGWLDALLAGLDRGYTFVGPVSNQPGGTGFLRKQVVNNYVKGYRWSDAPGDIAQTATELRRNPRYVEMDGLNGFCWAGLADTWRANAFDLGTGHVFNPAPALRDYGSEGDFFRRARRNAPDRYCAACTASFVWHYKNASYRAEYGKRSFKYAELDKGREYLSV